MTPIGALFMANANPPPTTKITMKINDAKELVFLISITSMI
jgi:hypothetical protein